jgi:hypothetical protein
VLWCGACFGEGLRLQVVNLRPTFTLSRCFGDNPTRPGRWARAGYCSATGSHSSAFIHWTHRMSSRILYPWENGWMHKRGWGLSISIGWRIVYYGLNWGKLCGPVLPGNLPKIQLPRLALFLIYQPALPVQVWPSACSSLESQLSLKSGSPSLESSPSLLLDGSNSAVGQCSSRHLSKK